MAKKKDNVIQLKPRKSSFLHNVLNKEILEVIGQYKGDQRIELVEHFITAFEEMQAYYKTQDVALLQSFTQREVDLLKKYRSAYKPYDEKKFMRIFHFSKLLIETGYYTEDELKTLPMQETALTETDVTEFGNMMDDTLHDLLNNLYLDDESTVNTTNVIQEKEEDDKEMTEARRLLAIYYLLKSTLGVEQRSHGDVTDYARFAHLLLGKKFSKMADSSIYKKYKKLPNFNKGRQLISDLEYIKPFFQQLNLQKAIELIDKEIADENNSENRY